MARPTPMFSVIFSSLGACIDRGVAEALDQRRADLLQVAGLQAGGGCCLRSSRPSSVEPRAGALGDAEALAVLALDAARASGLPLASSSITLEMWIGPSRSITPPSCSLALGAGDLLRARVALDHVQALDVHALAARARRAARVPVLPRSLPDDHLHVVAGADLHRRALARSCGHHSTSGASETIFMKLRSRSSRATGPNTRVPRGLFWSSMITAAFSSKAM